MIATRRLVWFLAIVLGTAGCDSAAPPLEHTQPSQAALTRAILDALERRDVTALRSLALTEQEFRDHVWPELPASRPERNLPLPYVWEDLHQKSEAGLARILQARGGQRYQLIDLTFTGGTSRYRTFQVHRESVATVADTSGARTQVHLFGSAIEQGGRLKVFSYVVD